MIGSCFRFVIVVMQMVQRNKESKSGLRRPGLHAAHGGVGFVTILARRENAAKGAGGGRVRRYRLRGSF